MAKRAASSNLPRPSKRYRPASASTTVDKEKRAQWSESTSAPNPASFSTRRLPSADVPKLTALALSRTSVSFRTLWEKHEAKTKEQLALLPDHLADRLLALLTEFHPSIVYPDTIAHYFLRPPSVTLTSALPGVVPATFRALPENLTHLELSGFPRLPDTAMPLIAKRSPNLQTLILRDCLLVGSKSAVAISKLQRLAVLNLSRTAVQPADLAAIIANCSDLEVLKLAAVKMGAAPVERMLDTAIGQAAGRGVLPLSKLKKLKLQGTSIVDASLARILALTPQLRHLDVSFTNISALEIALAPLLASSSTRFPLHKLNIGHNAIRSKALVAFVRALPDDAELRIFKLSRLSDPQLAYNAESFQVLFDEMARFGGRLEEVALSGWSALRYQDLLAGFLSRVGRNLQILDLSNIPISDAAIGGLLEAGENMAYSTPRLHVLLLNGTKVTDDSAVPISTCRELETLGLGSTSVTPDGLFTILEGCQRLTSLNLTGARGVPVAERRRFFEVWDEHLPEGVDT